MATWHGGVGDDDRTCRLRLLRLQQFLERYPFLSAKIHRRLLISLHNRKVVSIDELQKRARAALGLPEPDDPIERSLDHNQPRAETWKDAEKRELWRLTREYAARSFTDDEITDLINQVRKREEAHALHEIANLPDVSFATLADRVRRFLALPGGSLPLAPSDVEGLRVSLIRHFISDQVEFISVAKKYIRVRDIGAILDRIIGSERRTGKIGGKAAGMILANKILQTHQNEGAGAGAFEFAMPDSWFLRTDVIHSFQQLNGLTGYQSQKYKTVEEIRDEYPLILEVYRNAKFPARIVRQLEGVLDQVGDDPLIVRSSSLLEDRFDSAFSGKYASLFLANQGSRRQRLRALQSAIAEVFASTLSPDPLLYRRARNLLDHVEQMAVLIQRVVGFRYRHYYLPLFSGVAFSHNEFRWSPRIRKEDGLLRIVFGLGTRAVDRVPDYPRMVPLSAPSLRPETTPGAIQKYSQRFVDAIDLEADQIVSVPIADLLDRRVPFPELHLAVSVRREGELRPPVGRLVKADPHDLVITFDRLLEESDFVDQMRFALATLRRAYGCDVDVEFSYDANKLYILQCRPQSNRQVSKVEAMPRDVPADRIVFTAHKYVPTAVVDAIDTIVVVVPAAYDGLATAQERLHVARIISTLNQRLAERRFVLMGPGRWGSNDIQLGVRAYYSDLNHAKILVEIAHSKGGFVPEVSFGTHFFLDLVESGIHYLPLYPDDEDVIFNADLLYHADNQLAHLLPEERSFERVVRVIHLPSLRSGATMRVVMDGQRDEALAYLTA